MERVNNKHGIEMYYALSDITKIDIFDSNKKYFNDLYYDLDNDEQEEIDIIIKTLEETTLLEMCNFFNATIYEDKRELLNTLADTNIDDEDDYINTFRVKDKIFYTDSW